MSTPPSFSLFFFNDTATTEIYTLSLHDALPIWIGAYDCRRHRRRATRASVRTQRFRLVHALRQDVRARESRGRRRTARLRSEEQTSELQSLAYLVCRLLLEKKKKQVEVRHAIAE